MHFKSKKNILKIVATRKQSGILLAPKSGKMSRRIKESVDSELDVELLDLKGNVIYHDTAFRAGLEVIEGIFDIVKIKTKK
jgi:gas vesicle protein